jgi:hypothetical protein
MDTEGSDREERETPSAVTRRAVCTVLHFPQGQRAIGRIKNQFIGAKVKCYNPVVVADRFSRLV